MGESVPVISVSAVTPEIMVAMAALVILAVLVVLLITSAPTGDLVEEGPQEGR